MLGSEEKKVMKQKRKLLFVALAVMIMTAFGIGKETVYATESEPEKVTVEIGGKTYDVENGTVTIDGEEYTVINGNCNYPDQSFSGNTVIDGDLSINANSRTSSSVIEV